MNARSLFTLALAFCAASLFAAETPAPTPAAKPSLKAVKAAATPVKDAFKSDAERTFYAYGYQIGHNMSGFGLSEAEAVALQMGVHDAARSKGPAVNMPVYLPLVNELLEKRLAARAVAEKEKGKVFGEKFAKEPGVEPIAKGGWIKPLHEGSGPMATAEDTVKVHYRGTLIDGTEFDSSYKRNEPATFPLKAVIPCWTNGVSKMKVGGAAKLVCPSAVAYGDQGHPPVIPGGSTLVFDVELLEIVKEATAKTKK